MYLIEVPQGSIFEVEDDIYLIKTPQGGSREGEIFQVYCQKNKKVCNFSPYSPKKLFPLIVTMIKTRVEYSVLHC